MTLAMLVQAPSASDIRLVVPELILVCASMLLLLLARRIRRGPVAGLVTLGAAVAAGVMSYWILSGDAQTGFSGMIVVDDYSQFFKVLISATLVVVALISRGSVDSAKVPSGEFHALMLLAATGMMFAVSAVDLLTLYLGLELTTLCSFVLVGIVVERPMANEAAIKYFLLGSFASALLLYGISLTYGVTQTTEFAAIATALTEGDPSKLLFAAVALVLAGLAFKVAAVPFHSWAPDAYEGSLTPVAAFLAAGSKAAGLAALGRVALHAFGPEAAYVSTILVGLVALSVVTGSFLALAQTNTKRLLAYSSIAHAGYALMGLLAGSPPGASAMMTYAFFYVFMTLGAFCVVLALGERGESVNGFQGLAAQRPGLAALMLVFLLSLTGIPPTSGFAAKFAVIRTAVHAGHIELAVLAVLCSAVSAFIYMRIVVLMYMKEADSPAPARVPIALSIALGLALLITMVGGVLPGSFAPWSVSP